MNGQLPPAMQLLPAGLLAQFAGLPFVPPGPVCGMKNGDYRSPRLGSSTDFAEYREYSPGDAPSKIDWRVFGRSDRYYVKQYTEETNLHVTILLDTSGSMAFQGEHAHLGYSRIEYACRLAALLSGIFLKRGDAVGLVLIQRSTTRIIPARSRTGHLRSILETLHEVHPDGNSDTAAAIHEVAERIPRRGIVFLLSDLLTDIRRLAPALHHLKHRHHHLSLCHILAEEELHFPFTDMTQFQDLEGTCDNLDVDPGAVRRQYIEQMNTYRREITTVCRRVPADYTLFNTREPLQDVLKRVFEDKRGAHR